MTLDKPKLSRVEVEQLLERAKSVPAISFGYIRLAQDCLAYMTERDDLKESLRTTRLEQAAKAFQVDELETKVERLTAQLAAIDAKA